jgi:hypothetical protein
MTKLLQFAFEPLWQLKDAVQLPENVEKEVRVQKENYGQILAIGSGQMAEWSPSHASQSNRAEGSGDVNDGFR